MMFFEQSTEMNPRPGDDPSEAAAKIFREEGAALVLFDSIYGHLEPLYHDHAKAKIEAFTERLDIFFECADGAIYFYPDPKNSKN